MASAVRAMYMTGLAIEVIGFIVHIVGLATTEWSVLRSKYGHARGGLWEICVRDVCQVVTSKKDWSFCQPHYTSTPKALTAAEALAVIGLILGFVAAVLAMANAILSSIGKNADRILPLASYLVALVAGISIVVSITVYATAYHAKCFHEEDETDDFKKKWHLGYSFALSTAGGMLIAIGGSCLYIGRRLSLNQPRRNRKVTVL